MPGAVFEEDALVLGDRLVEFAVRCVRKRTLSSSMDAFWGPVLSMNRQVPGGICRLGEPLGKFRSVYASFV